MSSQQTAILALVIALLGLVVLLIDAGLLVAAFARRDAERAGSAPPLFAPRWSLADVWFGAQLVLVGTIMATVWVMQGAGLLAPSLTRSLRSGTTPEWLIVASLIPQSLFLIGVPVLYITAKYRTPLSAIGLRWPPGRRALPAVWLCPLMLVLGYAFTLGVQLAAKRALGPSTYHSVEQLTRSIGNQAVIASALKTPGLAALMVVMGGLVVPFAEEVFFRGFLFNCARHRLGLWGGILLSAVVFAVVHTGPLAVLAIIPVGIILAYAYAWTGSLWVPVSMHAFFNSIQLVLALLGIAEV